MEDRSSIEVKQYLSMISKRRQDIEVLQSQEARLLEMMPNIPEIENSVVLSEAEFSKALNSEIHRLKLTSNSNSEVGITQELSKLKVQLAKITKTLKADKPAKANQEAREQLLSELQMLKQRALQVTYKPEEPCVTCEARLKTRIDAKHDPQIQAVQEQIEQTLAELDKVESDIRLRKLNLGRTQARQANEQTVLKVQRQVAKAEKYANSLKFRLNEQSTVQEIMNSPM